MANKVAELIRQQKHSTARVAEVMELSEEEVRALVLEPEEFNGEVFAAEALWALACLLGISHSMDAMDECFFGAEIEPYDGW